MSTDDRSDAPESYPTSEVDLEPGMLVSAMIFSLDDSSDGETDLGIILTEEIDDLELAGPPYIACDVSIAEILDLVRDDDGLVLYRIKVLSCVANYDVEEVQGRTYLVHLDDLSPMDSDKAFAYLLEQIDILYSSSLTGAEAIDAIGRLYKEMKGFYYDEA